MCAFIADDHGLTRKCPEDLAEDNLTRMARRKTILLVEDESIIAISEAMTIKHFGYEVTVVNSGEGAIELSSEDRGIDLILMDINLGDGIDGPEAARRILRNRNIPIVFLSSHSEKEYVESIEEITRYGYIPKGSSDFVLHSFIKMAFRLFEANESIRIARCAVEQPEARPRDI
jgi:CheY-like chemotaxis protein